MKMKYLRVFFVFGSSSYFLFLLVFFGDSKFIFLHGKNVDSFSVWGTSHPIRIAVKGERMDQGLVWATTDFLKCSGVCSRENFNDCPFVASSSKQWTCEVKVHARDSWCMCVDNSVFICVVVYEFYRALLIFVETSKNRNIVWANSA